MTPVGSRHARDLATARISDALRDGVDLVSFWEEAKAALLRVVPYHLTPCWFTLDPESLLITSHYDHGMIPNLPHEWLRHEYLEDDFNSLADVARSSDGASTLHTATGGDPARSERWNTSIRPYGGEQELKVALRTRAGETWGVLALYRERGQAMFSDDEITFLKTLSAYLAEGAQRALLAGTAVDPDGPDPPCLVILNEDWSIESATPGAEYWLAALAPDRDPRDRVPTTILSVAGRALQLADRDAPVSEVALARVLTADGRWIVVHGAVLGGSGAGRVGIIIEAAHPARITPLLMTAYRLTDREQEVTRQVLTGASTTEIASHLLVSPHTVQQHLKSVFDKTGVRSRRELVGKIFFAHYEPRLRDNERRVEEGRPLRGGPDLTMPVDVRPSDSERIRKTQRGT